MIAITLWVCGISRTAILLVRSQKLPQRCFFCQSLPSSTFLPLIWSFLTLELLSLHLLTPLALFSIDQPLTLQYKDVSKFYMPRLNHSGGKNKLSRRTIWQCFLCRIHPCAQFVIDRLRHFSFKQGCSEVAACVLLGWRFGPRFSFWEKKEKEERNGYVS